MAIIDNQVYKLDNHNTEISNALYNCTKGEKHCKALIPKLCFYDMDALSSKYAKYMLRKGDYDLSELGQLTFLSQNEKIDRIVPIEKNWLGVFIQDKVTGEILQNKIMYLSLSGEGYVSDDVNSALNGFVPKEIYMRHLEEDYRSFNDLDKKYFDGTHNEFLIELFAKARSIFTDYFLSVIKSEETHILNQELKQRDDITLEELRVIIDAEFKRNPRAEDFPIYDAMDLVYNNLGCYKLIELINQIKEEDQSKSEKIQ